jgi:glycosyltransferase involved in cell wall biosynthesis
MAPSTASGAGPTARPRILVVAPFTHQNGHFVIFPRDISCALKAIGFEVTLLHTRPFRTELDWHGTDIRRICLRDQLESAPWWWKEIWARLASFPSAQCLAWIIWQVRPQEYDLVLWTDFQAQANLWPLTLARILRLYRCKTAFFEHHPPDEQATFSARLPRMLGPDRIRLAGLTMFVFSKQLHNQWEARLGSGGNVAYAPWGVWPQPLSGEHRRRARHVLGLDEQARVLLVFGVQAVKRKHIDTLREAAASLVPRKPLLLLFVGASLGQESHPFSGWPRDGIEARIEEGFIPEDKVKDYFASADAVWANYRDFPGASGALLQAMGFGRLSMASSEGEIGFLCREHNLGPIVASPNPEHLRTALEQFVTMPAEQQSTWEHAIAAVATHYAWPRVALQLMSQLGFNESDNLCPAKRHENSE